MVPDAEVLYIACEALTALDIGDFTIKVSPGRQRLLNSCKELTNVPDTLNRLTTERFWMESSSSLVSRPTRPERSPLL